MGKQPKEREMLTDPKYIAIAVQEFLLSLTKASAIHWGKFDQGVSLEDFQKQLNAEEVEEKERPCYSIDLRFMLGYMEDVKLRTPKTPNQLKEVVVTGHSLQLSIEQMDEDGEGYEPVLTIGIPLEVAAEAARSHREYEEFLNHFTPRSNK
jgi:hypothetical protein